MLRRALWRAAATLRPLRTPEPAAAQILTAAGHQLPSSRDDAGLVRRCWSSDARPSRDAGQNERRRDAGADAVGSSVDATETAKFARVADHWCATRPPTPRVACLLWARRLAASPPSIHREIGFRTHVATLLSVRC
jgi:hypothetical protein